MRLHRFVVIVVVASLGAQVPFVARAQNDKPAAEALLTQGLELRKQGNTAEACAKMEASLRLYPSLNTEYHLADCLEHLGKTASAWIDFQEVADKAHAAGESAKETKARERAAALAPKVARLTIAVGGDIGEIV